MNKIIIPVLAITFVAVVMGMSAVAPIMAHDVTERNGLQGIGTCPDNFAEKRIEIGDHPDHNMNGLVCTNFIAVVDDLPCKALNGSCPPAEPP